MLTESVINSSLALGYKKGVCALEIFPAAHREAIMKVEHGD